MRILALDLGTNIGAVYTKEDGTIALESWELATAKEIREWGKSRLTRRCDPRVIRLAERVKALGWFDIIIFEDVQFASFTAQVQLWSSFRAAVWVSGRARLFECVPVGTLKKFATGHGGATKEMMQAAMVRQYPKSWNPDLTDDAIDAFWLHTWATTKFRK